MATMQVMRASKRRILETLIVIAHGDARLVERALAASARTHGGAGRLGHVIALIKADRPPA